MKTVKVQNEEAAALADKTDGKIRMFLTDYFKNKGNRWDKIENILILWNKINNTLGEISKHIWKWASERRS